VFTRSYAASTEHHLDFCVCVCVCVCVCGLSHWVHRHSLMTRRICLRSSVTLLVSDIYEFVSQQLFYYYAYVHEIGSVLLIIYQRTRPQMYVHMRSFPTSVPPNVTTCKPRGRRSNVTTCKPRGRRSFLAAVALNYFEKRKSRSRFGTFLHLLSCCAELKWCVALNDTYRAIHPFLLLVLTRNSQTRTSYGRPTPSFCSGSEQLPLTHALVV
jgi:hypothetical protein